MASLAVAWNEMMVPVKRDGHEMMGDLNIDHELGTYLTLLALLSHLPPSTAMNVGRRFTTNSVDSQPAEYVWSL